MKKLGEKLSFLTKILLVIGLLISNLSSLSVVFAYEGTKAVLLNLEDNVLKISYVEELAEDVKAVNVKVYENYTYSGGLPGKEVEKVYSLTAEQLLAASEGTLVLEHNSMFASEGEEETIENYKLFDGTYNARVEIVSVVVPEETTVEEETLSVSETVESSAEEVTSVEANDDATNSVPEEMQDVVSVVNEETRSSSTTEELLAEGSFEKEVKHESGLKLRLFDSNNDEITKVDGKYPVSAMYSSVTVVAQILSGGLNPNDVFKIGDKEYLAAELLDYGFESNFDFGGLLFGEYKLPVEVKVLKQLPKAVEETSSADQTVTVEVPETQDAAFNENYEEVVYNDSVAVLYESYEMNSSILNMVADAEGYGEDYLFHGDEKDGVLYVLPEFEVKSTDETEENVVTKTMLDLYNMLNVALDTGDTEVESAITYTLLKDGVDVLDSYVPASEEDVVEDYLATIALDDTVVVTLANKGLSITYRVVVTGDLDNDKILTKADVLELINQAVGVSEVTDLEKSDLDLDEEVNTLDVLYLNQVVNAQSWDVKLFEEEATLDAALDVKFNDKELSEENYLTSGDEFTVDYVLSLTDYEVNGVAGIFNYDKTLFELVSVETNYDWSGNSKDGKFLYLGEESLTGPEETELPEVDSTVNDGENTVPVTTDDDTAVTPEEPTSVDYVVVKATFKTLRSTTEEDNGVITLKEIELFNSIEENVTYYSLDETTVSSETISVTASDDNTLSYLEVAGQVITLVDGVFEYEITVSNDVTATDLKYMLGNVAANVTSTVFPEELAEGTNTVIITVTSESGVSQDYTITIIREEAPKEITTESSDDNYYGDYEEEEEEVIVTPGTEEEEEETPQEEEESNLSRIVIIILILLVIAGLVYLIFKDEDDNETKKANKAVNKLKKQELEPEVKGTNKVDNRPNNKGKNKNSKNNKKER